MINRPPPTAQYSNTSLTHNIASALRSTATERSHSSASRSRPYSLEDLGYFREPLHRSTNPAARIFAERLEDILDKFKTAKINSDQHLQQCRAIQEAAEVLCSSTSFDDEPSQVEEILKDMRLSGMGAKDHLLTELEYVTICDDLAIQVKFSSEKTADEPRADVDVRVDARRAIQQGDDPAAVIAQYALTHREDVAEVQALAAEVADSGGPRADALVRFNARCAIQQGDDSADVIAQYALTHREDIAEVQALAAEVAGSGGPRADVLVRVDARRAIQQGNDPADVIAQYALTHRDDIAEVQALAARFAGTGD